MMKNKLQLQWVAHKLIQCLRLIRTIKWQNLSFNCNQIYNSSNGSITSRHQMTVKLERSRYRFRSALPFHRRGNSVADVHRLRRIGLVLDVDGREDRVVSEVAEVKVVLSRALGRHWRAQARARLTRRHGWGGRRILLLDDALQALRRHYVVRLRHGNRHEWVALRHLQRIVLNTGHWIHLQMTANVVKVWFEW